MLCSEKRSVLNARPLPPSTGAVQTPAGYGQLMNNPYSKVNEVYQPNPIWNPYAGSHSGIATFKVFIDRVWQLKRERKGGILQICFYVESNPHEPGSCAQACHLRCLATLRNNDTTSDSSRSDFLSEPIEIVGR